MKTRLIVLFTSCCSISLFSQYVLDSPYIYERYFLFQPQPISMLNETKDNLGLILPSYEAEEQYNILEKVQPIYKWSYLYSEPEYIRSRVVRDFQISETDEFLSPINPIDLIKDSDGNYQSKDDKIQKRIDYYLPYNFNQYIGVDTGLISQDTAQYSRRKSRLRQMNGFMEWSKCREKFVIKDGIVTQNMEYSPDSIAIVKFKTLLTISLKNRDVTPFFNRNFKKRIDAEKAVESLKSSTITSIKIKEDYFINVLTGKLTSSIIGVGFYDESKTENEELFWLYYPEFSYCLIDNYTIINNKLVSYNRLFERHLMPSTIEEIKNEAELKKLDFDYKYAIKHYPQIAIQLHKENQLHLNRKTFEAVNGLKRLKLDIKNNLPDGDIVEYYKKGEVSFRGEMKKGKCHGEFKFYFESGNIMAIRNYNKGVLVGEQLNYYENGNVYAIYFIEDGLITDLTRKYNDNSLMETGSFKNGLITGDWEYRFKLDSSIVSLLKEYHESFQKNHINYFSDGFSYKVRYSWYFKPNCNAYRYKNNAKSICMSKEIVD